MKNLIFVCLCALLGAASAVMAESEPMDFGDAPEGALAYPSGVPGQFPTCMTVGPASWIQHTNFGAWFGPTFDFEPDGNAGLCPLFGPYDADECFQDGDAGLLVPTSFTLDAVGNVVLCPNGITPMPLGQTCTPAFWGGNIDVDVHNHMPNQTVGFVNVLMDWNQDGQWSGASVCPGAGTVPEHVLVNFSILNPYDGPLSALGPPPFLIGPNSGYVWARISITERPVNPGWDGSGNFEDGETEDYLLQVNPDQQPEELDFGDAPDPTYPTLAANNGARHVIGGSWLGDGTDAPDPELDGQPTANADGDDLDSNGDDENGVQIPVLNAGMAGTITVIVSDPAGAGGIVEMWIDWNMDGMWAHPAEQIFSGFLSVGPNPILVTPPAGSVGQTYLRARISSQGGLLPTGSAPDGEVEDYPVSIEEEEQVKWEQLPDALLSGLHAHDYGVPYTQIIVADDWRCEGGVVTDFHWWGTVESAGAGPSGFHLSIHANDPTSCLPAEPPLWQQNVPITNITVTAEGGFYRYDYYLPPQDYFYQTEGQTYWFDVSALSNDPANPYVWVWAEHNRSTTPILCGAADKIIPTRPVWQTLAWAGGLYSDMAFRVTSDESIVERIDFGDAPDFTGAAMYQTLLANDGARHVIGGPWLGDASDAPDAEGDGQPSLQADGDDLLDGNDDEDGVIIPAMNQGMPANITLQVSGGGGIVEAWIDDNQNSVWEPSEQIYNAFLADGPHPINVTVPITAVVGKTYARFRISSGGVGQPGGLAPDGEVEDYEVFIEDGPRSDLGDAPDSTNSSGLFMTAYPAGGPPGVQANYPTVFNGPVPYGPRHISPLGDAWLGQAVTLEDEADIGLDTDGANNIDPFNDTPDLDGADDGLVLPVHMSRCKWTTVDYDVTIPAVGAGTYYVNIWCDWNRDGDWNDLVNGCSLGDVPEWAVRNQMLTGLPAGLHTVTSLPFVSWHPADSEELWMRITLAEQPWQQDWGGGGSGPINGYTIGETEDYYVLPDTSCTECADLNCDNFVDLNDFAIMASQWLSTCP